MSVSGGSVTEGENTFGTLLKYLHPVNVKEEIDATNVVRRGYRDDRA